MGGHRLREVEALRVLAAEGAEAAALLDGLDTLGRHRETQVVRERHDGVEDLRVARLGAHRNVWWSMANEWDFVKHRTVDDWNRLFDIVAAEDGHRHLTSIHHGGKMFDHNKAPITHVSIQGSDVHRLGEWRDKYGKPAVDDECEYEGDIEFPWGNITAQELVHRHWVGFLAGGYVGHGETYRAPGDVLWWPRPPISEPPMLTAPNFPPASILPDSSPPPPLTS